MKKTYLLIYVLILVGILLTSCGVPEEPQDFMPFCKELYEEQLADYPDYPPSFVGLCVAYLHTGELKGYQSLCNSASFRASSPEFSTRKECILYFQNIE